LIGPREMNLSQNGCESEPLITQHKTVHTPRDEALYSGTRQVITVAHAWFVQKIGNAWARAIGLAPARRWTLATWRVEAGGVQVRPKELWWVVLATVKVKRV